MKGDDAFVEFLEELVRNRPEAAHWTMQDVEAELCRLEAVEQDREKRFTMMYRERGILAHSDARLFDVVWAQAGKHLTMSQMFEHLRQLPRRGHRQQEALDVFDTYYAKEMRFPTEAEADEIAAQFNAQEKETA